MKCNKCGWETAENNDFCPQCGNRLIVEEASVGNFTAKLLSALRDPLFLVVCILLSATCLMTLATGSIPLIEILITIFLWLTYNRARQGIADANYLRCVSGTVYANYVISYVAAGLVLFAGAVIAVALNAVQDSMGDLWNEIMGELAQEEALSSIMEIIPLISGTAIFLACAITAAIMVVLNIFTLRYVHRFAKSVYRSIGQNAPEIKCANAAKIVLFILGGFSAVSCLSSLFSFQLGGFLANASSGGCSIIAGLLIHKYLAK